MNSLTANQLLDKHKTIWTHTSRFDDPAALRLHRAISWLGRAERDFDTSSPNEGDPDSAFLFLWIAFNACYARAQKYGSDRVAERKKLNAFMRELVKFDVNRSIYDAIWQHFSGPIRVLLHNRYVYEPFCSHYNGATGFEDWAHRFENSRH